MSLQRLLVIPILYLMQNSVLAVEAPERLTGSLTDGGGVVADMFKTVEQGAAAGRANPDEGKHFPRPVIVPLPVATMAVERPVISLDGAWKFTLKPPSNFWDNTVNPAGWSDIKVPGEAVMQGFDVQGYDREFPYKRAIAVPADYQGQRIFLRFESVYTYARVWVNGRFVRDHHGGFTPWTCEITDLVTPGQEAWLTVGVTDAKMDEYINNMSAYAQHSLLGITRGVQLFAVPPDHATRFHYETDFDAGYSNAVLKTTCAMTFRNAARAEVRLQLKDPKGGIVALAPARMVLTPEKTEAMLVTPLPAPLKWDAEHPNLYTLEANIFVDGNQVQSLAKKVGFRKVELKDRMLYVNGVLTKLRGAGILPIHPLLGRTPTQETTASLIRMFKQANINYIRLCCFPHDEDFYNQCNAAGLYLEDDAPLVHDGFDNAPKTPDAVALSTYAEQIEANRDHPSIIFWEIGNETPVGTKIPKMRDYLMREDATRILVWPSYNHPPEDGYVLDKHYPGADFNYRYYAGPVVYNEYGCPAVYCISAIKRDPNIRNYWGIGAKMFWERMYAAPGCLGGAIFAGTDDVFYYPAPREIKERTTKQSQGGEWGILDGWRRAKPEWWLTKKAFSPVRIHDGPVALLSAGSPLTIAVTNWFNHANLNEVSVRWRVGQDSGTLSGPDVAPGQGGMIAIPARDWKDGEAVNLQFDYAGMTVDEYNLPIGGPIMKVFPAAAGPAPKVTEDAAAITVAGKDFTVVFSKTTGKIIGATQGGTTLIEAGPELNLSPVVLSGWTLSNLSHSATETQAVITIAGIYENLEIEGWRDKVQKGKDKAGNPIYHEKPSGPVGVVFVVKIDGHGLITTDFTVSNPPPPNASQYGNTGYDEVGVMYLLPAAVDRIAWERKALWSAYPEDHIGRPCGTALRAGRVPVYREEPTWSWSLDEKTFYYFGAEDKGGRGCNDFRSTKENVWFYSVQLAGSSKRVRVESDATVAVRAEVVGEGRIALNVNPIVGYPALQWGNYCPIRKIESGYSASVNLRLTDQ